MYLRIRIGNTLNTLRDLELGNYYQQIEKEKKRISFESIFSSNWSINLMSTYFTYEPIFHGKALQLGPLSSNK